MRYVVSIVLMTIAQICVIPAAAGQGRIQKVQVVRFGAVPDDGRDDTTALQDALRRCKETGAARLEFAPGRYDFAGRPGLGVLFNAEGLEGLTIEGNGARLMFQGLTGAFAFARCTNLTIRNLTIDWDRPHFSVGRVLDSSSRWFDVEVEPVYPVRGGEPVQAFMDYDPKTRLPRRHGLDVYGSVASTELLRPQVLRVHLERDIAVPKDVLVVLRHQVYAYNAFVFQRCRNVRMEDVTVHTTPGMGLVAQVCENVTLERFRVVPRPGSRRPMSATADATHFGGCKGTVRLKDCVFEGMGDDGVNIKSGLYLSVRRREGDHSVIGQHNLKMADLPDPGDTLEVSHPETLVPFATLTVKSAVLEADNMHRLEFEQPLPADLREGDVLGNASRVARLRATGVTVRNNRARGMLIQTRDAVVEDCTFEGCTSGGVFVMTEVVHFFESIGTRKVTIRNCRFLGCNYGAAMGEAALMVFAYLKGFAYPPGPGVHRDIRVEGNLIRGTDNAGMFLAGVDGIAVRGNVIEDACRMPTSEIGRHALAVTGSRAVVFEKNHVEPGRQGSAMRGVLWLDKNVEEDNVKRTDNRGF